MSDEDVQYLRRKAIQFRSIAAEAGRRLSAKLRQIADELDAYAARLARQLQPPDEG